MAKKISAIIIYIIGCICVIATLMRMFIGGGHVSNPQAMIPYTDFDAGAVILGIGCIPMVLSCIFLVRIFELKKMKKILVFIPGIITAVPFIIGVGLFIIMMIEAVWETTFGRLNG